MEYQIRIDHDRCSGCGTCARVCLFSVLSIEHTTGKPVYQEDKTQYCIQCGHCAAFCPCDSIELPGDSIEPISTTDEPAPITPDQIHQHIRRRRSVRFFQPDLITPEIIRSMLDLAGSAPSAINLRPVEWTVISGSSEVSIVSLRVIDWMRDLVTQGLHETQGPGTFFPLCIEAWDQGRDLVAHAAPHMIIAHSRIGMLTASTDAIIAMSYLDLIAPAYGIGTCWTGIIRRAAEQSPGVVHAMGIPANHAVHAVMVCGYPLFTQFRNPRRPALPIAENI